ncbi:MAG TPA: GNAT family N-acetyltransferase [Oleiagrimonas sp.]|nr:GNAT family N-acetyltransferase [Oleiagrimonas sp.]
MVLAIRDVREHDLDAVLALNNAAEGGISPMDGDDLRRFFHIADYFRVAEVDGHVAGFLIALRERADHAGSNFLWFKQRYERFVFIDRIVVANAYRRHGLGRVFYSDVQSFAEPRVPMLACAVFLEPRDDVAVLFHGTYGFHEVGQQVMPDSGRHVGLLGKTLDSYLFVRDHYGNEENLPDVPWLAGRLSTTPSPTRLTAGRHA